MIEIAGPVAKPPAHLQQNVTVTRRADAVADRMILWNNVKGELVAADGNDMQPIGKLKTLDASLSLSRRLMY